MKILTITCDKAEQISCYATLGADEAIVAVKDSCFSSLPAFSVEEIEEICRRSPIRTAVLMNRLFAEEETAGAEQMLLRLLKCADAVFFADPALMRTAVQQGMPEKMIYRPETLLTSSGDAAWWMSQHLQSVQISPLLTENEIKAIASNVPHTGLQIHGRLLMSVSKRKLLTAYAEVNHLSKLADQKDLYLQEESRDGRMPVYENEYGTLIYTDFFQESFRYMQEFIDAGVERFEIDTNGLMQEAVDDALTVYRKLLSSEPADVDQYLNKYSSLPFETGYYGQKTVK